MGNAEKTINARITELLQAASQARSGTLGARQTRHALLDAAELVELIQLRAFEVSTDPDSDDVLELVVVTVHGVDLEIRGRRRGDGQEIYVHVDDQRDDDQQAGSPLVVDVYSS